MIEEQSDPGQLPSEPRPGSMEWCRQLELLAMEAMLRRATKAALSAAEVKHMVKLRQRLMDMVEVRKPIRWEDPDRWTASDEPRLAA